VYPQKDFVFEHIHRCEHNITAKFTMFIELYLLNQSINRLTFLQVASDSLALGVRDWTHCAQDRQTWKDLLGQALTKYWL
jgi:hypothetical protein